MTQVCKFERPVIVGGAIASPAGTDLEQAHRLTGNTGNLAFSVAIDKVLLGGRAPVFKINNRGKATAQGDVAVLPCANFLSADEHQALANRATLMDALDRPLVAIGLGAQAPMGSAPFELGAEVRQFVETIVRKRPGPHPNITVRGEFTRQVLEKAGFGEHVEVLGCPSLFLNLAPDLGQQIQRRFDAGIRRVAVGGWSKNIAAPLESALAGLATRTGGPYVVQHPKDLVLFAAGRFAEMDPRMASRVRKVLTPGMDEAQSNAWAREHARAFFNLEDWTRTMQSCDFFVGGRIHGTMLAIQAGIPAVCLVHDTRTVELCQMMGIPHVPIHVAQEHTLDLDQLRRWFSFDPEAFNQNRLALARRTLAFLANNGLADEQGPLARFVAGQAAAGAVAGSQ